MSFTPLSADLDIIAKLANRPNDTIEHDGPWLKEKFDESGNIIKDYINDTLLAELADPGAAENIGVAPISTLTFDTNLQAALEALYQAVASALVPNSILPVHLNDAFRLPQGYIALGAVQHDDIGAGQVYGDNIAGEAVTTAKIADEAVTVAKIADEAVTMAKLDSALQYAALYFSAVAVSATTGDIATVSDAAISADHVVAECVFADPVAITSVVTWTTASGTLVLNGTCATATTVNIVLVKKNN